MQLVDATTWERFGTAAPRDERLGTFDLSPDGTQFAAQDADRLALFDGTTGARQATIPLPLRTPEARLTYLPDSSGAARGRHRRKDLDRGHQPGLVGGPCLHDRRSQPQPRGVERVLPRPGLRGRLCPVAGR